MVSDLIKHVLLSVGWLCMLAEILGFLVVIVILLCVIIWIMLWLFVVIFVVVMLERMVVIF